MTTLSEKFISIFALMGGIKPSHYAVAPEQLKVINNFLPQKSKSLSRNFWKDVVEIIEPRLLVITGHLYLDYILERYLVNKTQIKNEKKIQCMGFKKKLEQVNKHNELDRNLYTTLVALNNLRNRFSHDIFYRIERWEAEEIPYISGNKIQKPRRKDLLINFNIYALKITFLATLIMLTENEKWIHLENIK